MMISQYFTRFDSAPFVPHTAMTKWYEWAAMTRQAFTIAAIAFVCGTAAAAPLVTYESPCECRDYHGKGRLTEKNDAALPPTDPDANQAVTPSDIIA